MNGRRRSDEEREISVVLALGSVLEAHRSWSVFHVYEKNPRQSTQRRKGLFEPMVLGLQFEGSVGHIALGLC